MLNILILGGTGDAITLANALSTRDECQVTTSLAGRTSKPLRVPGEVRIGGFGGHAALASYLRAKSIQLLVDATHPFAATISSNAALACGVAGVPRVMLYREPWCEQTGDQWIRVPTIAAAAAAIPADVGRVFLSTGRQHLGVFKSLPRIWFLVRLVEPLPSPPPFNHGRFVYGRGPFARAFEMALMQEHRIAALVSKNSGGAATYAKIEAARELGLPVIMIDPPSPPPGEIFLSVEAVLAWIDARCNP